MERDRGAVDAAPHVALSQHAHDRHGLLRTDERGSTSGGPTRRPGCWSSPGRGCGRSTVGRPGSRPQRRPTGLRVLLGERDGVEHFAVIVDPDDAPGHRDEWVVLPRGRAVARRRDARRRAAGAARDRAGRVALGDPALPALRRPAGARAGGSRAALHDVRPRPVPALRPRRDHGRHRRRARQRRTSGPAGPQPGRGRRAATPRSPASSSRARRWRTPYAARSRRRPASGSGEVPTSAASPGRCRPA